MWFVLAGALATAEPQVGFTPADAVTFAVADIQSVPDERRPYLRYVWIAKESDAAAVAFTLNTAWSRASVPLKADVVAGGRLVRVELDRLCPKDADLKNAVDIWEKQASQDFYFYIRQSVTVAPYKADDGKTYSHKWVSTFGGHTILKDGVLLQGMTKSTAPIQRFDRFIIKSLSVLDGADYYRLAGITKSKKTGQTDFEKFLDDHGVDVKRALELRADRRAAIFKSGVTAKPRAINEVQGLLGVATWSEDIADNNLDPKAHPVLTLLNPKFDASEAIALRANGFCSFALFNGKGELQDVVPDNIAKDHTIPVPLTARLQPAISCIRCHSQGKGFRTTRNDVNALLKAAPEGNLRFDILGDLRRHDQRDVLDELAGKYRGNLERLDRGRNDYSDSVFLATGGKSVEEASGSVRAIQDHYQEDVTPQRACEELGVIVDEADGLMMLRKLVSAESAPGGLEDARIGFLKAGIAITRPDFEQVFADMALRSRKAYEALAKDKK